MTREWSLHCKVCDVVTQSEFNHGDDMLREIHALREPIIAITQAEQSTIEVHVAAYGSCSDVWRFLAEHQGHALDLKDEYGNVEPIEINECQKNTTT